MLFLCEIVFYMLFGSQTHGFPSKAICEIEPKFVVSSHPDILVGLAGRSAFQQEK